MADKNEKKGRTCERVFRTHAPLPDGVDDTTPPKPELDDVDDFLKPLGVDPEGQKRKC